MCDIQKIRAYFMDQQKKMKINKEIVEQLTTNRSSSLEKIKLLGVPSAAALLSACDGED